MFGRSHIASGPAPDERQSWWEQWTYPDGRTTTSLCLHLEATNLTDTPIRFSAARLTRPHTWARVLENDVIIRSPDYPRDNRYSRENPILPFGTARVMSIIIFEKAIGRPGDRLQATLRLSDQFDRWHKLKFTLSDGWLSDRWRYRYPTIAQSSSQTRSSKAEFDKT